MDCAHFRSDITAFLEGSLPEEAMKSAEQHLATCMSCTRMVLNFREIEIIIAGEKAAEPNPFTSTRILQRIENEFNRPGKPVFPGWVRMLQPVTLALALLCGILLGSYSAKQGSAVAIKPPNTSENIEFLRTNLFISEFTDEDKVLVLNK